MMKWKARTETTNIGILELGNLTFSEDYMEVSIDIYDMSENLQEDVCKAIEIAKTDCTNKNKEMNIKYGFNLPTVWCDKPIITDFTYLRVILKAGAPITTQICIGFHDADNKMMEQFDCAIMVDISEYANELKKAIIKMLVDKFF